MSKVFEIRDYQLEAKNAVLEQLNRKNNTILALTVGLGKTSTAGFISEEVLKHDMKIIIIQHTEELIKQNKDTIEQICGLRGTVVKAKKNNFSSNLVFASRQTLAKANRRESMPIFDLAIIDECHILGYEEIVNDLRKENPRLRVIGLTATPYFTNGSKIFDNVAYSKDIIDGIRMGVLVPPVCKVIDLGITKELNAITVVGDDFNMAQAEKIMNKTVLNDAILESWKIEAGNRKTIAFCPTIEDAGRLSQCFVDAGIKSAVLHSDTKKLKRSEREKLIHDFTYGNLQCLMSVSALIAGFDSPPCSCVIIKRPFLYKSTFIQAVGRGLRKCNPNEFPDIYKKDCMVLDYTGASLKHGNLMSEFYLEGDSKKKGDATMKTCPVCEAELFLAVRQCPFCGYEYKFDEKEEDFLQDFQMTEYDLINASQFKWFNLSADQNCMMCSHFESWAIVVWIDDKWHGIANNKKGKLHYLTAGKKTTCIKACDDFLFATCKSSNGKGNKAWMNNVPTPLQVSALGAYGINLRFINTGEKVYDYHKTTDYPSGRYIYEKIMITEDGLEVSKYSATLLLTMMNNKDNILRKIQENQ